MSSDLCICLRNHSHNQDTVHFHHPWKFFRPFCNPSSLCPSQPLTYLSSLQLQLAFPRMCPVSFIHHNHPETHPCCKTNLCSVCVCVCMCVWCIFPVLDVLHFPYSFTYWQTSAWFALWANVSDAAMNLHVQLFMWMQVSLSPGSKPKK